MKSAKLGYPGSLVAKKKKEKNYAEIVDCANFATTLPIEIAECTAKGLMVHSKRINVW